MKEYVGAAKQGGCRWRQLCENPPRSHWGLLQGVLNCGTLSALNCCLQVQGVLGREQELVWGSPQVLQLYPACPQCSGTDINSPLRPCPWVQCSPFRDALVQGTTCTTVHSMLADFSPTAEPSLNFMFPGSFFFVSHPRPPGEEEMLNRRCPLSTSHSPHNPPFSSLCWGRSVWI